MELKFPVQFEQVKAKKVSDFIFDQLEEAIILKDLLPEEQLPTERELAIIFNASRLAVREALEQLEEQGLIEKRVGAKGGTFVLPVTLHASQRKREELRKEWAEIETLLEYRAVIEPEGAYLCAERISSDELDTLYSYVKASMEPDCSRELFRALDVKLHLLIARASGNVYIEKAVRQIRTRINLALDIMEFNPQIRSTSYEKHMQLLEAISRRDAQQAKQMMAQHIKETRTALFSRIMK